MADNWWEKGSSAVAAPQGVARRPVNPYQASDEERASRADVRAANADARAAADSGRDAKSDAISLQLAQLRLAEEQRKAAEDTARKQNVSDIEGESRRMIELAESLKRRSREDFGASGIGSFPLRMIPGTSAYDTSANVLTLQGGSALEKLSQLRQSSPNGGNPFGQMSNADMELLKASVANLDPGQSDDQFQKNLDVIIDKYSKLLPENDRPTAGTGTDRQALPAVAPTPASPGGSGGTGGGGMDRTQQQIISPSGGGDQMAIARGGSRVENNPALQGVNSHVEQLVRNGASGPEVRAYLQSVGVDPAGVGGVDEAIEFRRRNPTYKGRYSVNVDDRSIPLSAGQTLFNAAGTSPIGAATMNVADALTAGNLDSLTANPELTRTIFNQVSNENPLSTFVGQVTGGAAGAAGVGRALGLGAKAAGVGSRLLTNPITADAIYGSLYGAGQSDDNRTLGALGGAALGATGGMFGQRVASGLGRGVRGVTDESAQFLKSRGVRMTPGQMLGGTAKAAEDRRMGFSGLGDRIRDLRRGGVEDFNRAAFDDTAAATGLPNRVAQIGERGTEQLGDIVSTAYDQSLGQINLSPDPQFRTDIGGAAARASQLPPGLAQDTNYILGTEIGDIVRGRPTLGGRDFQAIDRTLGKRSAAFRQQSSSNQNVLADRAADVLDEADTAFFDLVDRQAPGAVEDYTRAKKGYGLSQIINDAVIAGRNTGGVFTPAQLGNSAVANTRKFGGKAKAASTDRAFFDLQRAGQDVLPSTVPDSGTAGRIREGSLPQRAIGALGDALRAPLYSDALNPVITSALLDRPDVARKLGQAIVDRRRLGGMFGASLGLQAIPAIQ